MGTPESKALDTLDGMKKIIEHEMIVKGTYVTDVWNHLLEEQGAVCGGRRYCVIGAMVVSYGIQPYVKGDDGYLEMSEDFDSAIGGSTRRDFYATMPGLDMAHDALNEVALAYATHHGIRIPIAAGISPIEALFERTEWFANTDEGREVLCLIIDNAKALILGKPMDMSNLTSPYATYA